MKQKQVSFIVDYVLLKIGYCRHNQLADCKPCIARWIRQAIRKSESAK